MFHPSATRYTLNSKVMPKAMASKEMNSKFLMLKDGAKSVLVPRPKTYDVSRLVTIPVDVDGNSSSPFVPHT